MPIYAEDDRLKLCEKKLLNKPMFDSNAASPSITCAPVSMEPESHTETTDIERQWSEAEQRNEWMAKAAEAVCNQLPCFP